MFIKLAILAATLAALPQHPQMPAAMTHEEHMKQLQERGTAAMGFDQNTTQHAFTTTPDGGSIAVEVKNAADVKTRDQIRAHLKEIAGAFASGDFTKPFQTHAEVPPGVPVMAERKDAIRYAYSNTAGGGILRISTKDAQALDAIHAFLKYQNEEHNPHAK
ncbi:MAG: hypothetical protein ACRD2I_07530 [Vicinamibacterales bacterium]